MSSRDPIAYKYDADTYCPSCAEKRFGLDGNGQISGEDSERNPVGAIFPWDEWWEPAEPLPQTLLCGTCGDFIAEIDGAYS